VAFDHPSPSTVKVVTGFGHNSATHGVSALQCYSVAFTVLSHNSLPERAEAQAVTHRILTTDVRVRCRNSRCEESGDGVAVR
jgi:hypothetical protein